MKPYEKRGLAKGTMYTCAADTTSSRTGEWKEMLYEVMETGSAEVRASALAAYPAQQDPNKYDLQWPYNEMDELPAVLAKQTDDNTYKVTLK